MFGIPEGVDMAGFIHYWKVLGYLHGIKDDFKDVLGGVGISKSHLVSFRDHLLR